MTDNLLEKLRQMLLDMHHSGRLSYIEPTLYENSREYVEGLKTKFSSMKNPLEGRKGSLLIEEIGSVTDTVQEIFSVRTRQILDLAFQQIDGRDADREEIRKMLPAERAMYAQIVDAITLCRGALIHGEEEGFSSAAVDNMDRMNQDDEPAEAPAIAVPRSVASPYTLVHMRSDAEPFMGVDGRTYALMRGDIVTVPEINADVLCEHDIALNIRLNK